MSKETGKSATSGEYRVVPPDSSKKGGNENGQSEGGHLWLRLRRFKPMPAAENSPAKHACADGFPVGSSDDDIKNDSMCWMCHTDGSLVCCDNCPRVYHVKCLGRASKLLDKAFWMCPVCQESKSAGDWGSVQDLPEFLLSAVKLMYIEGCEPFERPVDMSLEPSYKDYIFNPMDLQQLEQNIKNGMYKCPQQLQHDAQWILHNCIIYNGIESTLTDTAKAMLRICKREVSEIALCPDCYRMSMKKTAYWFTKPCAKLHKPVWAKVKGYPFWPAKVLNLNGDKYDVRFFGDHNRAKLLKAFIRNVSNMPSAPAHSGWVTACREMELYITNLKKVKYTDTDLEVFPGQQRRNSTEGCIPLRVDRIGVNKETSSSRRNSVHSEPRRHSESDSLPPGNESKPSRCVVTDSLPPGNESKPSRRVVTRRNTRAKHINSVNSSEFLQNSIITATPKANIDRLAVDTDDLTKRLRSDAYSSLKSGREAENGSSASFMGTEQTYVASADGMTFTFVAADQERRKSGAGPELIEASEMPKTSWLEFQGDDGSSASNNVNDNGDCVGELSELQMVDGKTDVLGLSDLTGSNLVDGNAGHIEPSGRPVEGCDDVIDKGHGMPDTESSDDVEVQICQVINKTRTDRHQTTTKTSGDHSSTKTSGDRSSTKQPNSVDPDPKTSESELSKLESVLKTWTGRWNDSISKNGKNATERSMRIERAVKRVLSKSDQQQLQQTDQVRQAQQLLLLTTSRSLPTQTEGASSSTVTTKVSNLSLSRASPLSSLISTVSQIGQQSNRQASNQSQTCLPTKSSNQSPTIYRVLGTVIPPQSLPSGTVTLRTVSRCPPILPKPLTPTLQSVQVQSPAPVLTNPLQPNTTATPLRIQVCPQQQPGTPTNRSAQPTVILRSISASGQPGAIQTQPVRILNTNSVPQTVAGYQGNRPHQSSQIWIGSPIATPSVQPSRATPNRLLSPPVLQQQQPPQQIRSLVFPESSNIRPVASAGVNNPTSSHQSVMRPRQHGPKDTAAPKYSGSLFAALHDAMLADDQNPVVQRENVTAGVDRIMFSVWRQVEEVMMTLQQDTEQHYKKKLSAALAEQRQQLEEETRRAVEETKKKHWCANCLEEAGFYCCFNTSYCSLDCQQQHWPLHVQLCRNSSRLETGSGVTQRSNSEPPAGSDHDICIVSVRGATSKASVATSKASVATSKASVESCDTGLSDQQTTDQLPVIV